MGIFLPSFELLGHLIVHLRIAFCIHVPFYITKLSEETKISWCAASGTQTLNLEKRLDHDGHPLAIAAAETVAANGVSPWNWRETPANG